MWVNRQYDIIMEFTRQTENTWLASSQEGLESSICLLQCVSLLHPHTSAIFPLICLTPRCSCRISDIQTLKCEGLTSVILSLVKSQLQPKPQQQSPLLQKPNQIFTLDLVYHTVDLFIFIYSIICVIARFLRAGCEEIDQKYSATFQEMRFFYFVSYVSAISGSVSAG